MKNLTKSEHTREKVIRASLDLINRQGYTATSMDDITGATGVKKGNLYFHFSSKEELTIQILTYAREDFLSYLKSHITDTSPLENIRNIIEADYRLHRKKNFIGGCIFGNIALEMGDSNTRLTAFVRDVLEDWIGLVHDLILKAISAGELKISCEPESMARHIVASLEGGVMFARISKNGQKLRDCINAIYSILGIKPYNNLKK